MLTSRLRFPCVFASTLMTPPSSMMLNKTSFISSNNTSSSLFITTLSSSARFCSTTASVAQEKNGQEKPSPSSPPAVPWYEPHFISLFEQNRMVPGAVLLILKNSTSPDLIKLACKYIQDRFALQENTTTSDENTKNEKVFVLQSSEYTRDREELMANETVKAVDYDREDFLHNTTVIALHAALKNLSSAIIITRSDDEDEEGEKHCTVSASLVVGAMEACGEIVDTMHLLGVTHNVLVFNPNLQVYDLDHNPRDHVEADAFKDLFAKVRKNDLLLFKSSCEEEHSELVDQSKDSLLKKMCCFLSRHYVKLLIGRVGDSEISPSYFFLYELGPELKRFGMHKEYAELFEKCFGVFHES